LAETPSGQSSSRAWKPRKPFALRSRAEPGVSKGGARRLEGRSPAERLPGIVGLVGKPFFVYILRCSDGSCYVGHTDNLEARLAQHHDGHGSAYTSARRPVELAWHQDFETRSTALEMERKLKGWNRAKKEALIEGRFDDLCLLSSRGVQGRALRDALLRKAPQGERE